MSRKLIAQKFQVYSDLDSTAAAPSTHTDVGQCDRVSYEFTIDPTVIGEFFVEYNNDKADVFKDGTGATWVALQFSPAMLVDGSVNTEGLIEITENNFQRLRLNFTNNAGTGNINAWVRSSSEGA